MSALLLPAQDIQTIILNKLHEILMWRKTGGHQFKKYLKFAKVADNKDKLLKILQYLIKLLIFGKFTNRENKLTDFKSFASTLSLARRLGRLGNWTSSFQDFLDLPMTGFLKSDPDWFLKFTSITASLGTDLLDDWICLQKGKLLKKVSYIDLLDSWSTNLWFISTSIDLYFNIKKLLSMYKDRIQCSKNVPDFVDSENLNLNMFELKLAISKQCCDWIFCWWEIADLTRKCGQNSELIPILSGLISAIIGALRGWRKLE